MSQGMYSPKCHQVGSIISGEGGKKPYGLEPEEEIYALQIKEEVADHHKQ